MGAGVVNKNHLGGCGSKVLDNLGQSQRGLGGRGEGIDSGIKWNGGIAVIEESLAASSNVGKAQLGRRLSCRKGLKLVDEALSYSTSACIPSQLVYATLIDACLRAGIPMMAMKTCLGAAMFIDVLRARLNLGSFCGVELS